MAETDKDKETGTTVTGSEISSSAFLVRTNFKLGGKSYKMLQIVTPDNEGWKGKQVIELVRTGRIMPYNVDFDTNVFHEIVYLTRRSPLGLAAAEMRDVISTGKLDDSVSGQAWTELEGHVAAFSTYCINQLGEKVATTKLSVIPEDRFDIPNRVEEIFNATDNLSTITGSAEPMIEGPENEE